MTFSRSKTDIDFDCLDEIDDLFEVSCQYYDIDTFNRTYSKNKEFSIINFNIRSLSINLDSFLIFLNDLSIEFDIIVFTETWTTKHDYNLLNIPG